LKVLAKPFLWNKQPEMRHRVELTLKARVTCLLSAMTRARKQARALASPPPAANALRDEVL
jgi:hypothetical protein